MSARRAESRLANPIVTAMLRSPLHPLLSRWILLLSYEGRKSGRRYTTPVLYRRLDRDVVVFTPREHTNWWRNFRHGYPLRILVRGEWRAGQGEVVFDETAIRGHLAWLLTPLRRTSGVVLNRTLPSDERLQQSASAFALVRVRFLDGETVDNGPNE